MSVAPPSPARLPTYIVLINELIKESEECVEVGHDLQPAGTSKRLSGLAIKRAVHVIGKVPMPVMYVSAAYLK